MSVLRFSIFVLLPVNASSGDFEGLGEIRLPEAESGRVRSCLATGQAYLVVARWGVRRGRRAPGDILWDVAGKSPGRNLPRVVYLGTSPGESPERLAPGGIFRNVAGGVAGDAAGENMPPGGIFRDVGGNSAGEKVTPGDILENAAREHLLRGIY